MDIQRPVYLQKLKARMHNGMIKVITGLRRCGKSYLLFESFRQYLHDSGVSGDHIIGVELDMRRNEKYRDPDVLLQFLSGKIRNDGMYYILLDEVQMLRDFEAVLNELLHFRNADVYVTGSNSKFLSSDIITEFRGRGDEIRLHPLAFSEYFSAFSGKSQLRFERKVLASFCGLVSEPVAEARISSSSPSSASWRILLRSRMSLIYVISNRFLR